MPLGPPAPSSAPDPGTPGRAPGGRAGSLLAWGIVLGTAAFLSIRTASTALPDEIGETAVNAVMEGQVRFFYGYRRVAADLLGKEEARRALPPGTLYRQMAVLERGPVSHRHRFAVVAGDLAGPAEAVRVLEETRRVLEERGREFGEREGKVQEALLALYGGGGKVHGPEAVEGLSPERADLLREELGWFGSLALAPEGSPARDPLLEPLEKGAGQLVLAALAGILALGVGLVGSCVFWALAWMGRVRFRFETRGEGGGPYVEAFALWLLLFLGISLAAAAAGLGEAGIAVQGAVTLPSLAALAWLPLRGIPWSRAVRDLGLRFPGNPVAEAAAGVWCWILSFPVLLAGFLASFLLSAVAASLQGEPDALEPVVGPYHPILGEIREGAGLLALLFAASVCAPLVEEVAFRGLLYRHVREGTARLGRAGSVLFSALVTGVVFASVHPQGWTFIPALASVAWALVHAREWRDSLLAPVAAHAVHNATVLWFATRVLGPA